MLVDQTGAGKADERRQLQFLGARKLGQFLQHVGQAIDGLVARRLVVGVAPVHPLHHLGL